MPTTRTARSILVARGLAAAIVAGLAASAPTSRGQSAPPVSLEVPGGALVASGPPAQVTLLYTGDVIGFLDPCG